MEEREKRELGGDREKERVCVRKHVSAFGITLLSRKTWVVEEMQEVTELFLNL